MTTDRDDRSADELERYRRAAEDALQQLDWAIGFLHGIRKSHEAEQLARNRSYIRKQLMGRDSEPVPS